MNSLKFRKGIGSVPTLLEFQPKLFESTAFPIIRQTWTTVNSPTSWFPLVAGFAAAAGAAALALGMAWEHFYFGRF